MTEEQKAWVILALVLFAFWWLCSVAGSLKAGATELRKLRLLYTKHLGIGEDPK